MTQSEKNILLIGGLLTLVFMVAKSFTSVLQSFLPSVEGFSAVPIWDYNQWSWGYGTAAGYDHNVKPAGAITREQAWKDALQVINQSYNHLKPQITVKLNPKQWAALLSFAYNLGVGNADHLVANINAQDTGALVTQWKKYINAGGQPNQGLINRRNKEVALWLS